MKKFIRIEIQLSTIEEAAILMAELAENNFYAFEEDKNILTGYINETDFDERKLTALLPDSAVYTSTIVEDRNWNEEWESQLQPIIIKDFVAIRAAFHEAIKNVEYEIIITPKMSFGTGHHATTYLMIDLMQKIDFINKSVLDFGTGTGILAILAEKSGASSVLAIDNDEWSISNAIENIEANNSKNIIIERRDTIAGLPCVDIILANINFNVLQENAHNFSKLSVPGTILIISGFLAGDEENIVSVFAKKGFIKKQKLRKEDWMALQFGYETIF